MNLFHIFQLGNLTSNASIWVFGSLACWMLMSNLGTLVIKILSGFLSIFLKGFMSSPRIYLFTNQANFQPQSILLFYSSVQILQKPLFFLSGFWIFVQDNWFHTFFEVLQVIHRTNSWTHKNFSIFLYLFSTALRQFFGYPWLMHYLFRPKCLEIQNFHQILIESLCYLFDPILVQKYVYSWISIFISSNWIWNLLP